MKERLPIRFWIETALAAASGILLVVTLVWRTWIETIFGVDPDKSSGSLEWIITGALLIATVVLVSVARREYRKAHMPAVGL